MQARGGGGGLRDFSYNMDMRLLKNALSHCMLTNVLSDTSILTNILYLLADTACTLLINRLVSQKQVSCCAGQAGQDSVSTTTALTVQAAGDATFLKAEESIMDAASQSIDAVEPLVVLSPPLLDLPMSCCSACCRQRTRARGRNLPRVFRPSHASRPGSSCCSAPLRRRDSPAATSEFVATVKC
jgi:hypothetical protein